MKKKYILGIILLFLLSLVGCENNVEQVEEISSISMQDTNLPTEESSSLMVALNMDSQEFEYPEGNGISYLANYENLLYMTHSETSMDQGIFCMEVGGSEVLNFYHDFSAGAIPTVITTDLSGNVYVVVNEHQLNATTSLKLLKISPLGVLLFETEFIQHADEYSSVWAITVDADGYIYVRTAILDGILLQVFDHEGNYIGNISDEEGTYKLIDALGRDLEGNAYAILTWGSENKNTDIFKISGKDLSMQAQNITNMPSGVYYGAVSKDRDGYFISYNISYGVQKHLGNATQNFLVSDKIEGTIDGARPYFLADGRLLLLTQEFSFIDESYQIVGSTLYYIPLHFQ